MTNGWLCVIMVFLYSWIGCSVHREKCHIWQISNLVYFVYDVMIALFLLIGQNNAKSATYLAWQDVNHNWIFILYSQHFFSLSTSCDNYVTSHTQVHVPPLTTHTTHTSRVFQRPRGIYNINHKLMDTIKYLVVKYPCLPVMCLCMGVSQTINNFKNSF